MYLVDPTGAVLSESLADGQRSGQPMGRAYAYVDSDLPTRFKDQFAPLQPLHADKPFNGTLLRLPLRTQAQVHLHRPPPPPSMCELSSRTADADARLGATVTTSPLPLRLEQAPMQCTVDGAWSCLA